VPPRSSPHPSAGLPATAAATLAAPALAAAAFTAASPAVAPGAAIDAAINLTGESEDDPPFESRVTIDLTTNGMVD